MKTLRWALFCVLLFAPLAAHAQNSWFSGVALGINPFIAPNPGGTPGPVYLSYAPVRVCNLPLTQTQPCLPLASVTDFLGNPLSVSGPANFGQLTTNVVGGYQFGCQPGQNLQIQVAPANSATPSLSFPATCPSGQGPFTISLNGSNTWTGPNAFNGNNAYIGLNNYTPSLATCANGPGAINVQVPPGSGQPTGIANQCVGVYMNVDTDATRNNVWGENPVVRVIPGQASGFNVWGSESDVDVSTTGIGQAIGYDAAALAGFQSGESITSSTPRPSFAFRSFAALFGSQPWNFAFDCDNPGLVCYGFQHQDTTLQVTQSITGSGSAQNVTTNAVYRTNRLNTGAWISIDSGVNQEDVQVISLTCTVGQTFINSCPPSGLFIINAIFTKNHANNTAFFQYGSDYLWDSTGVTARLVGFREADLRLYANASSPYGHGLIDNTGVNRLFDFWISSSNGRVWRDAGGGWTFQSLTGLSVAAMTGGGSFTTAGLSSNLASKNTAYTLTCNDHWINATASETITIPHALNCGIAGQQPTWVVFASCGPCSVLIATDSGNLNGLNASLPVPPNSGYAITCDLTNCFAQGRAQTVAVRGTAGCTTGATTGNNCTTPITVTWTPAFPDTNYTAICWPSASPTNFPTSPYQASKAAGNITINYNTTTNAAASWATIDCTATHD